jgi:signal transduction histidine kinase
MSRLEPDNRQERIIPKQPILIVEDSLTQAEALRHTLETSGYQCVVARDGKEALDAMRQQPPSLIISDIVMPEMDGYAFCKAVKTKQGLKAVPVILLTALTDSTDIIRGLECGADNFVTKPYADDYLLTRINALLHSYEHPQLENLQPSIELEFNGQHVAISAGRRQILDMLLSTYEQCVQINYKLRSREQELEAANTRLGELYEAEQGARAAAEEANHSKDAFLAMVTHELRSPLNAMLGWTRVLRTKKLDEASQQHALETIEASARTQAHLIEDLLDTARIASGKMRIDLKPVDLVEVVNAALAVVRPAAEARGIELISGSDTHANLITGDPDRLQQVFWNLLSNAIKFTPANGRVEIRLERADPFARITVSDTGRGIPAEFLPHVFERFSQQPGSGGSQRRGGLGLGLSLAKHLVELHGGTIEADSPGDGQGATFTVKLPLRALRPKAKSAKSSVLAGVRALVVDDDDDARELVRLALSHHGALVTPAASAAEALAVLETGQTFDVLISDIGMPEVNGYDLVRQVRALQGAESARLPAVALTAFGRSTDRIRALAAGFQMHVPKPVEPEELIVVVATLTGRTADELNV